ncbi:MAG TPA: cation:dicarboxylase symporter family transporter, partial [candidate division Zixibacteria bacterium]|nr:cation:dicarboxylase symporter family transporter [candidate division Zixibacteria bacterium]
NALYMIIVPLIVASMVVGITALGDVRKLGKTARHTMVYFIATSAIAVTLGIVLAVTFRPGVVSGGQATLQAQAAQSSYKIGGIGSLRAKTGQTMTTRIVAPDISSALAVSAEDLPAGATIIDNGDGSATFTWRPGGEQAGDATVTFFAVDAARGTITETVIINVTDDSKLGFWGMLARIGDAMQHTLNEMIPRNIVSAAADTKVLALIVFSLFFGGVLSSLGRRAKPLVEVFEIVNDAIMKLVHLVMYLAPFGVFGIVASKVGAEIGGFSGEGQETLAALGWFSLVTLCGLLIHTGLLLVALRWLADRNPFTYLVNMSEALGTALGVSSSSATLPVTMECVVEKNRVDQRAASFVLPLGTTINMDGTAMYQAISAIFVCQLFNVPLGIEHYIIILVTAVLASIGTPGLPQAGIVMMSIVMGSVGVPPEIIAQGVLIILVVDWALDRARTALNVFGDSVGAAVIANTFEFKTAVVRHEDHRAPRREERPARGARTRSDRQQRSERAATTRQSVGPSAERERPQRRRERERSGRMSESPEETRRVFQGMIVTPAIDVSSLPEGYESRREPVAADESPSRRRLQAPAAAPEPVESVEAASEPVASEEATRDWAPEPQPESKPPVKSIHPAAPVESVEPVEPVEPKDVTFGRGRRRR